MSFAAMRRHVFGFVLATGCIACESDADRYSAFISADPTRTYDDYVGYALTNIVNDHYNSFHNRKDCETTLRLMPFSTGKRMSMRMVPVTTCHDHHNTLDEETQDKIDHDRQLNAAAIIAEGLGNCKKDADSVNTGHMQEMYLELFSALKENGRVISSSHGYDESADLVLNRARPYAEQHGALVKRVVSNRHGGDTLKIRLN